MQTSAQISSDIKDLQYFFKRHKIVREQRAHSAKVHSVGWSCEGRRLASGSFDKTVVVYTLDRDRLAKDTTLRGHTASVDQLCWHAHHPDLLSTASGDKSVRIWDARAGRCSAVVNTKGENINITWSPDGKTIAVGNKDDLVTFIDARTNKIKVEKQFNFEVNEIAWNKNNNLFFLTSGTGSVHVLSYPNLESMEVLRGHPATCICIEFDPTGKYFAVGSADSLVSVWNANELSCQHVIERLEWPVRTISFSHDGKLIASGSEDLFIDIAYATTGEKVTKVPVDASTFTVAWNPKKYLLAYACDDKDNNDRRREAGNLKVYGFEN
ncbi:THO complex subunit 3-like [Teleopsis dalmanni]|uniref:THO complex subunit 3-like n=1 Tax=Teleopsis dalmanni TaxID=139649 RepID=UPI0018CEC557|nr:THO complex subunit 3-like [Teleopsis dalmanni]XP_037949980.1 THO complex subunit 3-like [Teleopsis dalmanni]